jgi:hypothetical protein
MAFAILAFWNSVEKDLNWQDVELAEAEYAITDGSEPIEGTTPSLIVDLSIDWRTDMEQLLEAAGAPEGSVYGWLRFYRGDQIDDLVVGNEDLWQLWIRVKSADGLWSRWSHSIDKGDTPAAPGPIEIIKIPVPDPVEPEPEPEPPPPEPEPIPPPTGAGARDRLDDIPAATRRPHHPCFPSGE